MGNGPGWDLDAANFLRDGRSQIMQSVLGRVTMKFIDVSFVRFVMYLTILSCSFNASLQFFLTVNVFTTLPKIGVEPLSSNAIDDAYSEKRRKGSAEIHNNGGRSNTACVFVY
jgi:hypothetical protein